MLVKDNLITMLNIIKWEDFVRFFFQPGKLTKAGCDQIFVRLKLGDCSEKRMSVNDLVTNFGSFHTKQGPC